MTTVAGAVVQPAVSSFSVDVAIRKTDASMFQKRENAYAIIGDKLQSSLEKGIRISVDDLFGWAICVKLGDVDGRRTKRDLASQVEDLKKHVLHDLSVSNDFLRFDAEPGPGITEYVGVGAALSVVDAVLGLDSSYFRRILETPVSKTLDFEGCYRASTGSAYVQIEARGRTDGNNSKKAWDDIDEKKSHFRSGKAPSRPGSASLPVGAPTYLIGVVAEVPLTIGGTTRVVVGDPPIPSFGGDPGRAKLLQRLRFYQRVLSVIQPRGVLLAALSERIGSIERIEAAWEKFAKQPIINSRMEPWELAANIAHTVRIRRHDQIHGRSLFPSKDHRGTGDIGTEMESINQPFFFMGLHRQVLLALVNQDFDEIANLRYTKRYMRATIDGVSRTLYQLHSGLVVSSLSDDKPALLDAGRGSV